MKVLHINSFYFSNALHQNLIEKLGKSGISQFVYVPVSNSDKVIENYAEKILPNTTLFISKCFNNIDRYLWPLKMLKVWRDFKHAFQVESTSIIHAHSLIVNGSIALLAKRKYGKPYFVTIRNTDVNIFMKKSSLFRALGKLIISESDGFISLSPAYYEGQIKSLFNKDFIDNVKHKHHIVPNGADDFWFDNKLLNKEKGSPLRILFVGRVSYNKNLKAVIDSCNHLSAKGKNIELHVLGDGPLLKSFTEEISKYPIIYHGYVNDKNKLLNHYRESDILVVPSFTESFGLVYVEAMTQSLPVIYTKGQGFDGFFDSGIYGFAVNPNDSYEIAEKIDEISTNYSNYSNNALKYSDSFSWGHSIESICELYKNIYV
jgi:glycosyltransferase involved in cell wall biosynthesis